MQRAKEEDCIRMTMLMHGGEIINSDGLPLPPIMNSVGILLVAQWVPMETGVLEDALAKKWQQDKNHSSTFP